MEMPFTFCANVPNATDICLVADLELGQPGGQAARDQRGEPADQRDHLGGDAEHPQHDQVRDGQDDPRQDGEPALVGRLGEGHQDLIRGGLTARPAGCGGNPRAPHRYFSH
jgi:hypothetical protein